MAVSLARAGGPTLAAPSAPPVVGQLATFPLTGAGKAGLYVDGCAPVELEHQEGDRWVAEPVASCPAPTPAMELSGSLAVSAVIPRAGTWRAKATWGTGCIAGRPFVQASCRAVGVATSPTFVVGP